MEELSAQSRVDPPHRCKGVLGIIGPLGLTDGGSGWPEPTDSLVERGSVL